MDPSRKMTKKFIKKFDSKVINRQYFHRKTGLQSSLAQVMVRDFKKKKNHFLFWYKNDPCYKVCRLNPTRVNLLEQQPSSSCNQGIVYLSRKYQTRRQWKGVHNGSKNILEHLFGVFLVLKHVGSNSTLQIYPL